MNGKTEAGFRNQERITQKSKLSSTVVQHVYTITFKQLTSIPAIGQSQRFGTDRYFQTLVETEAY